MMTDGQLLREARSALVGLVGYVTDMAARTKGQAKEMVPDARLDTARRSIEKLKERLLEE